MSDQKTSEQIAAEEQAAREAQTKAAAEKAEQERIAALTGDETVKKLIEQQVAAQLAKNKEQLDAAYKVRDEALREKALLEEKAKAAEIKRLQDEGKEAEALKLQLEEARKVAAEEKARREAIEQHNTELSRDSLVRAELNVYTFRTGKAANTAFQEIVGNLTKNDKGEWAHKTGLSVKDYVKTFMADEEQSYLLKPKQSSGAGGGNPGDTPPKGDQKSLFKMSQAEVMKLAAEGKLPNQK